jgi:uncharacterized protein YbbC (DUF1343 family)
MPQVTVYIRAEDLKQWKSIEMKAQFIHQALEFYKKKVVPAMEVLDKQGYDQVLKKPVIKTKEDAKKVVEEIIHKKTNNWGA